MTLAKLAAQLIAEIAAHPEHAKLSIKIEHREYDDDSPENVGIYAYHNKIGLSFWRD